MRSWTPLTVAVVPSGCVISETGLTLRRLTSSGQMRGLDVQLHRKVTMRCAAK